MATTTPQPKAVLPGEIRNPAKFFDPEACRDWLLKQLHPTQPACPGCGYTLATKRQLERFWTLETVRCPKCRKTFSGFTGTIFKSLHMKLPEVVLMMLLFKLGCRNTDIAEAVGLTPTAIAKWRKKFKKMDQGKRL